MQPGTTTVERAFHLAGSGQVSSVDDIRRKLKGEGYGNVDGHLAGATIKAQLSAAISKAGRSGAIGPGPG